LSLPCCAAPDPGGLAAVQDPEEADMPVPRERLLEAALPEMPYGESGEAAPSLIPYQVMSRSEPVPGSLHIGRLPIVLPAFGVMS
jgi:hypothetical protein